MSGFKLGFVNVFVLDFLEHCKKKLRNLLCIKWSQLPKVLMVVQRR